MFANIVGVILAVVIILIIYLSFYVGRLMVMKDKDAVDDVITNDKKGKSISSRIYLLLVILCAFFIVAHFIF